MYTFFNTIPNISNIPPFVDFLFHSILEINACTGHTLENIACSVEMTNYSDKKIFIFHFFLREKYDSEKNLSTKIKLLILFIL